MDEQKQDGPLERIYNSSVRIQDIGLKTSWEQWTIETGSERGSGRSVVAMQHDDDDDDDIYIYALLQRLNVLTKELPVATHIMQSSSNELGIR